MRLADTPELAAFRAEVRAFIRERFPAGYRPDFEREESLEAEDVPGYNWPVDRASPDPARAEGATAWVRRLAERGWVAPHWPGEYGGGGLSVLEQHVLVEEMAEAGVPTPGMVGLQLLGPTLIAYGTEEQKREHLPRILAGEVAWAQGFSEPGAGSDLASLRSAAERRTDEETGEDYYLVNGQKTWTSHAQFSDWIFVLVRTDPDAEGGRHRGISMLLIDLDTPGITVRPIEDPRGDEPFAEVFFDDVRVPAANLVGEEGRGFYVAMATLDFERSGIGGTMKYRRALEGLIEYLSRSEGRVYRRPDFGPARLELADRYVELSVLYLLGLRTVSMQAAGQVPNQEASVAKLFGSEAHQRLARSGMKAFGPWGNLWQRQGAPLRGWWTHDYLDAVPHTILSGSSEIMRNVIATRGLGLPRG